MEKRRRSKNRANNPGPITPPLPFSVLFLSLFTLCLSALFSRSLVCEVHLRVQCQANLKPQLPFSVSLISHKGQFSPFPFLGQHAPVSHQLWGPRFPSQTGLFCPAPFKTSSFSFFLSHNSHVLRRDIQPSLHSSSFALLLRKARLHLLSVLVLHHHHSYFQL